MSQRTWGVSNPFGLALLATASGLAISTAAQAAVPPTRDAAPVAAAAQPATAVETIVVTAQKREANIESVPVSIDALAGSSLERRNITDFGDLTKAIPDLTFRPNARFNAVITMRGSYDADTSPGLDNGVQIYIDDVPTIGNVEAGQEFFDEDRIEVLHGPQGTLFGRNVTAGLIDIHTKQPSFTPEADAEIGYGNYSDIQAKAYVTGPISEQLAGKLALVWHSHDGYINNVNVGRDAGRDRAFGLRGQLLFKPTDGFRVLVGGELFYDTGDAEVRQMFGNFQPNALPAPFTALSLPEYRAFSYDPNRSNASAIGAIRMLNYAFFAKADWDTKFGTLTSLTGYRNVDRREVGFDNLDDATYSATASPLGTGTDLESPREHADQVSEELRFTSPADQRLRWVAGAFFLAQHRNFQNPNSWNYTAFPYLSAVGEPASGFLMALPSAARPPLGTYPGHNRVVFAYNQKADLDTEALFGQLDFDIVPQLTLTVGGRYSWEHRSGFDQVDALGLFFGPPTPNVPYSGSWADFTPAVTLTYKPVKDIMFYATYARGFKGGGFDQYAITVSPPSTLSVAPFPAETADNYEFGTKDTFFNGRLVTNLSVYREDYTNLQTLAFNGVGFATESIPTARAQGVEASVTARPFDWLTVGATYAFDDAKFICHSFIAGTKTCNGADPANHLEEPANPPNTLDATWNLSRSVAGVGDFSLGGDVLFRSKVWLTDTHADFSFEHARTGVPGLVNLHAVWTSENGAWSVEVWGKNVNNVRYNYGGGNVTLFFVPLAAYLGGVGTNNAIYSVFWNPPPTYGVTLHYRFH
jgi:iron complex outermembrane receptor protein